MSNDSNEQPGQTSASQVAVRTSSEVMRIPDQQLYQLLRHVQVDWDLRFAVALHRIDPRTQSIQRLLRSLLAESKQSVPHALEDYRVALRGGILDALDIWATSAFGAPTASVIDKVLHASLYLRNPADAMILNDRLDRQVRYARLVGQVGARHRAARWLLCKSCISSETDFNGESDQLRFQPTQLYSSGATGEFKLTLPEADRTRIPTDGPHTLKELITMPERSLGFWLRAKDSYCLERSNIPLIAISTDGSNVIFEAQNADQQPIPFSTEQAAWLVYELAQKDRQAKDYPLVPPHQLKAFDSHPQFTVAIPLTSFCPLTGYFWLDL